MASDVRLAFTMLYQSLLGAIVNHSVFDVNCKLLVMFFCLTLCAWNSLCPYHLAQHKST